MGNPELSQSDGVIPEVLTSENFTVEVADALAEKGRIARMFEFELDGEMKLAFIVIPQIAEAEDDYQLEGDIKTGFGVSTKDGRKIGKADLIILPLDEESKKIKEAVISVLIALTRELCEGVKS